MASRICNQLLVRSGRFRKIYCILDCTWSNSLSLAKDRSFASIALQEYQAEFLSFQRICFFQCRWQKTLSSSSLSHAPSTKQMEQFLASQELAFEHGHTSILATCPFCSPQGGKDKPQEDLSLYINKTTGSHVCKQCKSAGSWNQFKVWVSQSRSRDRLAAIQDSSIRHQSTPEVNDKVQQLWTRAQHLSECSDSLRMQLNERFEIQKLKPDMLNKYQVRVTEHKFSSPDGSVSEHTCLAFPWYDASSRDIQCVKLVRVDKDDDHTLEPRYGVSGLFGWNTVPADAKQVVLTHNEFDAIAVHQATGLSAISLPLGTHSLPPEVLPQLEQFEKIILWFGSDVRSRQAANQFSRKLNIKRCFFVRPTEEMSSAGALDALNKGYALDELIKSAQPISHEKIVTFHQLRNDVYGELVNADQVAGVKWTRFPKLSNILKGHRRGELTIFTGPTGAGKTTLLSEMSLDLCLQGVNTLWGSFEIRNVRLLKTMLNQFTGVNLQRNIQQFHYWADKFEALPMYFMSFYGSQSITTVIETMTHAAYVYDIEHVIVDNLQFMTSYLKSEDRFSIQNHAISAFRQFATTKNVHVTLVIHPRKENDDVELQTASIFGTAKASQEADNVMILQDKKGRGDKYLQITKNRFDGTLGRVPLDFVRETISMSGFGKTPSKSKDISANAKKDPPVKAKIVADLEALSLGTPHPVGKAILSTPYSVGAAALSTPTTDPTSGKSFRVYPAVERSSTSSLTASVSTASKRESYASGNAAFDYKSSVKGELVQGNLEKGSKKNSPPEVKNLAVESSSAASESADLQLKKKSNAVRAEVKRRLSGTKLFTKAINTSSSYANKKSSTSGETKR